MANGKVHVVGIVGSLRNESHTRKLVRIALDGAEELGATTALVDLREYRLPFQDGDDAGETEEVLRLRADVAAGQGIILGTPEYHGSYSGVLKNALDLMGFDEFEGKMMGLVGVAGGALGATSALNDLRGVGRSLHAWVIPEQAGVPRADAQFDDAGRLKDPRIEERVRDVGRQVARFAYLHNSQQWRDFLRMWEGAPPNPGGAGR